MRPSGKWPILLLLGFFMTSVSNAQSSVEDEAVSLPATLSAEQLQTLQPLTGTAISEPSQLHPRRRLPRPEPQLSPAQVGYKLVVQKLGVDTHRFVHVDLPKRKVRTGVITQIEERGFVLKDGIIFDQWISYSDLQAAPRPVAAVGTRIGQGFKWAGLGLAMVAAIPLLPFAFLFWDGC